VLDVLLGSADYYFKVTDTVTVFLFEPMI